MSINKLQFESILKRVQKPGRYAGGEQGSVIKSKSDVDFRFAFCFPDTYEIGMSHLGMKILYGLFNELPGVWCERVFAPWVDMEAEMRTHNIPLFGLESRDPISRFDMIGFTLQYELSYTNVLNMIDLAGLPVKSADRQELLPIICAGGPCVCNAEPIADFIDLFFLGEGEEVDAEVIALLREYRDKGASKREFLEAAAKIEGVYVPSLYDVKYNNDNTVESITPLSGAPATVRKRIISDMDKVYYPENFVVPFIEVVHDRVMQEIFRGCIRGCRFCQAGFLYRPVREKSPETINAQARALCENTGYDEISLSSLSTSDYSKLDELLPMMIEWTKDENINLALPSLRVDNFSKELMEKIKTVRQSGLTFAPEAGTQRLRNVINKNVTDEEIMRTARIAFEGGYTSVKLYFMMGLPTETLDDLKGIAETGQRIVDLFYSLPSRPKGKGVNVTISVAVFVPKPFTPFQWHAQDDKATIQEKQKYLLSALTTKKIRLNYHDADTSFLEAVFARGDRRLGAVIYDAWKNGAKFDSWGEFFDLQHWITSFDNCGVDPDFYACRERSIDEVLPWSHLDYGVTDAFLKSELEKAKRTETTPDCKRHCGACGAAKWGEGLCVQRR